ncbi:hypothetical protein AGMMS49992_26920 [Clostridia bacterium]|nr:hypothetical protein AGMMS49992_26920 [Clostridia bacterium]
MLILAVKIDPGVSQRKLEAFTDGRAQSSVHEQPNGFKKARQKVNVYEFVIKSKSDNLLMCETKTFIAETLKNAFHIAVDCANKDSTPISIRLSGVYVDNIRYVYPPE